MRFHSAMAVCLVLVLASFAGGGPVPAAAQAPLFADYPAQVYSGPVRAPNLASHPDARTYATRLRNAAKGPVNFAGEYVLAYWGCGAECLMGAAINARTGQVIFLPGSICCWFEAGDNINPIDYKIDSHLIILRGLLNEQEPRAAHYYEMRGGQFRFIQRMPIAAGSPHPAVQSSPPAQAEALICYYDLRGVQHDADTCKIGRDLSEAGSTQLQARCLRSAGANCTIGNSGPCRPGAGKYSQYQVYDRALTERCPPSADQATDGGHYSARDAAYVTTSRNPDVVQYVLCLAEAVGATPRNVSIADALADAEKSCLPLAQRLRNLQGEPNAEDIRQSILHCGFRRGDASPDADCG